MRGHLVIAGGGTLPSAVWAEFAARAGGASARIAVITDASNRTDAGVEAVNAFREFGAEALTLRADAAGDARSFLESATGVWMSGGDQNHLMSALAASGAGELVSAMYGRGVVVGGTSAGAAVMSERMITGNELEGQGSDADGDAPSAFRAIRQGGIETSAGLGLLREAIVDQHFLRRKRHNRLICAVLESQTKLGVGIDEETALVVEPSGLWRVIGASSVVVYDARRADVASADALGATGMLMHVLPAGSTYHPELAMAKLPGAEEFSGQERVELH